MILSSNLALSRRLSMLIDSVNRRLNIPLWMSFAANIFGSEYVNFIKPHRY